MLTDWGALMEKWDNDTAPKRVSLTTRLRHSIRHWIWAPSSREIWLLRGDVENLKTRCAKLEAAMRELNPGLSI